MATTVRPDTTAASDRSRCRAARGSSSEVASSSTRVCGSASTSRASASCCACALGQPVAAGPDDRVEPARQPQRPHPGVDGGRARRAGVARRLGPGQAQVVLERADEDVVLLGHEGDLRRAAGPARGRRVARRRRRRDPSRGPSMPAMSRPSVDLPAPDGPTIASRSPGHEVEGDAAAARRDRRGRIADVLDLEVGVARLLARRRCGPAARRRCR